MPVGALFTPAIDPDDPREQIEFRVVMANGRLHRGFDSQVHAKAWADESEYAVEFNLG